MAVGGRELPDEWFRGIFPTEHETPVIDTSVAQPARVYDYLLGGKDNFAADRAAGDQIIEAAPSAVTVARLNRAFLGRAVRFLASDCGIRQFLDIGPGIPSSNNTHEVVQAIAPEARVMYVDDDPMVMAHARAWLTGTTEGAVAYLDADLRDPDRILRAAAQALDFRQPVALLMLLVLDLIPDKDEPHQIVARLVDALPGGSYLALSHPPSGILPEDATQALQRLNAELAPGPSITVRSYDDVARFFSGLDIVPPGLVPVHQWRPESDVVPDRSTFVWGAVARKPLTSGTTRAGMRCRPSTRLAVRPRVCPPGHR
jgi:hypothetical protein